MQSGLTTTNQSITNINSQITEQGQTISGLSSDFTSVDTTVTGITSQIAEQNGQISQLNQTVNILSDTSATKDALNILQKDVTKQNETITNLQSTVEKTAEDLNDKADKSTLTSEISALQTTVNQNKLELDQKLSEKLESDDLSDYAQKIDLDDYAKTNWVNEQLDKIEHPESAKGDPGKSAYEIAKENGFEGSEEKWLESLKGQDGESIEGKSAYEIWLEQGNTGTEEDFLNSLKGEGIDQSVLDELQEVDKNNAQDIEDLSNQIISLEHETKGLYDFISQYLPIAQERPVRLLQLQLTFLDEFNYQSQVTLLPQAFQLLPGEAIVTYPNTYDGVIWSRNSSPTSDTNFGVAITASDNPQYDGDIPINLGLWLLSASYIKFPDVHSEEPQVLPGKLLRISIKYSPMDLSNKEVIDCSYLPQSWFDLGGEVKIASSDSVVTLHYDCSKISATD